MSKENSASSHNSRVLPTKLYSLMENSFANLLTKSFSSLSAKPKRQEVIFDRVNTRSETRRGLDQAT